MAFSFFAKQKEDHFDYGQLRKCKVCENESFDYLLVALEFYSFQLLINLLIIANVILWVIKIGSWYDLDMNFLISDQVFSAMTSLILIYFLFRQQTTFYHQKWYWAAPKTILLLFLIGLSINYYRMMLFYITMWTL